MENSKAITLSFIDQFEHGQYLPAMQMILSHPDIHFDEHFPLEEPLKSIIHYVDASLFYGGIQALQAGNVLQNTLAQDPFYSTYAADFIDTLKWQENFLKLYLLDKDNIDGWDDLPLDFQNNLAEIKKNQPFPTTVIDSLLEQMPLKYQGFVSSLLYTLQRWQNLKTTKPEWASFIEEKTYIGEYQPWYAFSYKLRPEPFIQLQPGQVPVIFLEPLQEVNYSDLLAPLNNKKVVFIFETITSLLQMLQFSGMENIFADSQHLIYILDRYPNKQFLAQNFKLDETESLQPYFLVKRKPIEDVLPQLLEALTQNLKQSDQELQNDTPSANWLYHLSKRLIYRIRLDRYGPSSAIALSIIQGYEDWHSSHKGLPPAHANLGPLPRDYVGEQIANLSANRQARPYAPSNKIRLAHVVPQVLGLRHAPTKILFNLFSHADTYWFLPYLLSTERLVKRPSEYPVSTYVSLPSFLAGNLTLLQLQSMGVSIHIEPDPQTYEQTAHNIAKILSNQKIDVVIFHGPDEVNCLCSAQCDVPIRIMFEHGTPPRYPCFDLTILSTEDAYKVHHEEFRKKGMESCYLNFSVDLRENWPEKPFTREELGLPSDAFVMTTISNHLDHRLSTEMCHAIGEVLQRCPTAYYAPMGPVEYPERMRAIWKEYGVNDRINFLGEKQMPSQYARSMNLYLNEFPFGSCLGMLDAMAAGCPVVSMYDEKGPPQAKYAGAYFGSDRVITSGKKEDYVQLACKLIEDPEFYREWSEHALLQYDKRADVKQYVKRFEKIIERFIEYRQNAG